MEMEGAGCPTDMIISHLLCTSLRSLSHIQAM